MKIGNFDFSFLQSTRFWMVVLAVLAQTLIQLGVFPNGNMEIIANAITAILGVSVTIRTIDRFGEQ